MAVQASKPFSDPAIRRVLWKLIDQKEALTALDLDAKYTVPDCPSFFMCGTPLQNTAGDELAAHPSVEAARAALKQTNYAGEKVVILQANDIEALKVSSELLADKLRRVGFNVELVATDSKVRCSRSWRHQRLSRSACPSGAGPAGRTPAAKLNGLKMLVHGADVRNGSHLPPAWLAADRDELERDFARQCQGTTSPAMIRACWAAADAAERRWHQRPSDRPRSLEASCAAEWETLEPV